MVLYAEHMTIHTNFSTHYLVMFKVYSDVDDIKLLCHGCPPVWEITHSLKLVGYLLVRFGYPRALASGLSPCTMGGTMV